jgi:thymidine kinase
MQTDRQLNISLYKKRILYSFFIILNQKEQKMSEKNGYLCITYGPMFSGKTSCLIEDVQNQNVIQKIKGKKLKGIVVNYEGDDRDIEKAKNLSTHNKNFSSSPFPKGIQFLKTRLLIHVKEELEEYDYIAIDEAQFFSDILPVVLELLEKGKHIHCVGLISDRFMKPFGKLIDLFPYADECNGKKAYCFYCKGAYRNAPFTKHIGVDDLEDQEKVGAEEYVPVCRYHFYS